MTSQPGKQTIAIHILLDISRSKSSVRISAIKSSAIQLPRQKLEDIIYLGNTSAIFLAKQSDKSLYLLQQTPCNFSAVTSGISHI